MSCRAACLALVALLAAPAAAAAHSRTGEYEYMAHHAPRNWRSPYPFVRGIPAVREDGRLVRNPVTAAQYGLLSWSSWWRWHDRRRLRAALRVADWLVATQRTTGKWVYRFRLVVPGTTMALNPPWSSALAQGQAISLLRRAYQRTHRRRYLRAALRGLVPLEHDVAQRGLSRRHDGGLMFEEYPAARPVLPLNGDLQTLFGLYDLSDLSHRAARLFRRGLATVPRVLHEYDAGSPGRSLYDLGHEVGFPPLLASPGYNDAHVEELRILDRISPHAAFRRYAARWAR